MIAYLPEIYQDELLYSWLSRTYVQSGYMSYLFFSQEIYARKAQKPNIEFINELKPEIVRWLTRNMEMGDLIKKHTMFPYYGRFMRPDRRNKMFDCLVNMDVSCNMNMGLPRYKNRLDRYLRYCPLCAKEDREKYGETYWHRVHQISGISVCPEHKCLLQNSNVIMNRNNTTVLFPAEEAGINDNDVVISRSEFENTLSCYMAAVFQSDVNMCESVGEFLKQKIQRSEYTLYKSGNCNMQKIHSDFLKWYKRDQSCFEESWQIGKVLTDVRSNFDEVCILALFLNLSANELARMKLKA